MSQTIAILGRQPALGIAELESLYGAKALQPIGGEAVLLNIEPAAVDFARLGGSIKLARLITSINSTEWPKLIKYISDALPQMLHNVPEGKIRFGLSLYGLPTKTATISRSSLDLKRVIKRSGRSVRVVPNSAAQLNAAQIIHNQLTGPTGIELLLVKQGKKTLLAQTIAVQDIDAYAARDQARPKRDARVGMLPPKLAQIIVNMAVGQMPAAGHTVLDPFCGTGVILQEASLMGFDAYGSDLEPRMVEYSQANLDWLDVSNQTVLEVGDATSHHWSQPFSTVAAETYLGRPFTTTPRDDKLRQVMSDVDLILSKFLKNLALQTEPGLRACLALPAWRYGGSFKHLKLLDSLDKLGYTRVSFVHAGNQELIYHREGQIVGRELVVIVRK